MTSSRERVYEFIVAYLEREGWAPALAEISSALGFSSRTTAKQHVDRLVREGRLERGNGYRQLRLPRSGT